MTEIERARRHVLKCQERLVEARALRGRLRNMVDRLLADLALEDALTAFLAALSWMWDAQERANA